MAEKKYTIENLDCANCAAKIERKMNELAQVDSAVITFATRELRIRAENPDALLAQLEQIARSVEVDARIVERSDKHAHHEHKSGCSCGHEHHHDHDCCDHEHHHDHDCCDHEHHHDHDCCCHDHHDHHGEHCACGHDHHDAHNHSHHHAHDHHKTHRKMSDELVEIVAGAILFAVAAVLHAFHADIAATILYLVSYAVLGWKILKKAAKNIAKGHALDENFLMSIASVGALVIGEMAEGVGVMLFYRVGEYFEEKAMERSRAQIMDAVDMRPDTVSRIEGDSVNVIDAESACVGDLLLIRPGDRIPLDCVIVEGSSRIDTAPITGESVPVSVRAGERILSGCLNGNGQLTVRVEKPLSESMVTRILNSVENAAASKPKIDRFITRFARIYTPVVVGAAAAIALIPSIITKNPSYWIYTALSFLVMSCPCALVLSVPLAFFAGIGSGSRKGILFKGGVSMEAMSGVRAVVMDKTGTLTEGNFCVQQIVGDEKTVFLAASCEQNSTHPIAQSITSYALSHAIDVKKPQSLEEIAGRGIRAVIDGAEVLCGSARLLQENGVKFTPSETAATSVYVAFDGAYIGCILISDTLKKDAPEAIRALRAQQITTVMLTGDNERTAQAVASSLGIDEVHAKLLPEQKLAELKRVRSERGAVMFVGDGINDAPVLAGADVGAAMGSGADAAIEAADVVFMTNDVGAIAESIAIAKRTNRIAWQNVVFALAIKAIVMMLGLFGHASMWLAVFADSGVAMLCVLNSIRTLYRKK